MPKLPRENQELTRDGGKRRCGICRQPIEEGEMTWYGGMPAHEDCAYEEEQELQCQRVAGWGF